MQCVRLVSGITFISMFKVKNTWWFSCLISSICTWNFVNDCENSYEKKVLTALVNHSPISRKRTNISHLNSLDIKTQQHMAFRDPDPGLECTQKTHYFKFQVIFFWNFFRTQLIGLVIRGNNSISFVVICIRALFLSVMPIEIQYCV